MISKTKPKKKKEKTVAIDSYGQMLMNQFKVK